MHNHIPHWISVDGGNDDQEPTFSKKEYAMKYYFGGYYLVQGVDKPSWISNIDSSSVFWTLTDCICNFMPSYELLPGHESADEKFSETSGLTGLSKEDIEEMKITVNEMLSKKQLGWPNVFNTLESAQLFYGKYLSKAKNFNILGMAFSEEDAEELIEDANLNKSKGLGLFEVLSMRQEVSPNIKTLGFEILGLEYGGDFHSFLCNGLEKDFTEKLGIEFNETGRIQILADAKRAEAYINQDSAGAEPVPWYMCLVFEQPVNKGKEMNINSFDEVIPLEGTISARIFENEYIGLKPTLFFDIEIPLQRFHFNGEEVSTTVALDFIRLPKVKVWQNIARRSYQFPFNPEEGYIDGSVYLGDAHNPADVTHLIFGDIESEKINCKIKIVFDFTCEGPEEFGKQVVEWDIKLNFDEKNLDAVISEAHQFSI